MDLGLKKKKHGRAFTSMFICIICMQIFVSHHASYHLSFNRNLSPPQSEQNNSFGLWLRAHLKRAHVPAATPSLLTTSPSSHPGESRLDRPGTIVLCLLTAPRQNTSYLEDVVLSIEGDHQSFLGANGTRGRGSAAANSMVIKVLVVDVSSSNRTDFLTAKVSPCPASIDTRLRARARARIFCRHAHSPGALVGAVSRVRLPEPS